MGSAGGSEETFKNEWRRRRRRRLRRSDSVQTKVKKLQKLIPGGQGLKPDRLLLRAADYILQLKLQVDVLQALSNIQNP